MAVFTHLETDTGTNADISSATAIGTYTATADKLVMVDVSIDQVAGNGDYVMYVTRQIGGSGSAYRILPETTMAAASGLTAISAQSGWITVRNGDVLTCYVDGLAGDTSTPDWTTRWFEDSGTITGVTLADDAITAAKFDESTAFPLKSADTGSTQVARVGADSDTLETLSDEIAAVKAETAAILVDTGTTLDGKIDTIDTNVDSILADTGTDGVKIADTQGAITWGQQKIIADAEDEGALHIVNTNDDGAGQANIGGDTGVINFGQYRYGVWNISDGVDGMRNEGVANGTYNKGKTGLNNYSNTPNGFGMQNQGLGSGGIGVSSSGTSKSVNGFDPLQATEATLTAIKGQTDKIPASPASAGEYTTNIGAIKAKTDNLPLSPASSGEYTSALTAIQNDLDNPNQYKADVSNLALQATSLAIKGQTDKIPATPASAGEYTTNIGAIKAKTDNLPASPAPANEYDAELAALQADLDNADQYKADVSGLATTIHVQEVENKVDLIDVTTVANSGKIDAVDTKVSAIDTDTIMSFMIDGFTFEQIVQIMASVLAGKLTRSGDTLTFRDLADTVNRVVAKTDANKQRTTMTYTV